MVSEILKHAKSLEAGLGEFKRILEAFENLQKMHASVTAPAPQSTVGYGQPGISAGAGALNRPTGRSSRPKVGNALLNLGPPPAISIAHHPHSSRGLFVRLDRSAATSVLISYPGNYAVMPLHDVPTDWFEPCDQQARPGDQVRH